MKSLTPSSPITSLHGVGPTAEKRLAALGVRTIEELLWHVPFRYEDYRETSAVQDLQVGQIATVRGT
ncbi:MAG: hypothetical protein V1778_00570, partial [bacterium]